MATANLVYEFELYERAKDGRTVAEAFDFETVAEGASPREAAAAACNLLQVALEHCYIAGIEAPLPSRGNKPRHPSGRILLVAGEDPRVTVRKMRPVEAARVLGVTPARISQLSRKHTLEAFVDERGKHWVTVDSVERRRRNNPGPGNPKRNPDAAARARRKKKAVKKPAPPQAPLQAAEDVPEQAVG